MDSQKSIISFVKIVGKHPVLYDPKLPQRTPLLCSLTWEQVAEQVRQELNENCTVDELKTKWKGIRSSFTRFKRKMERSKDKDGTKQYYLYDSLQFLLPHTKTKRRSYNEYEKNDDESSEVDEWDSEMTAQMLNEEGIDHTNCNTSDSLALPMHTSNLVYPEVKIEPIDHEHGVDTRNINEDSLLHIDNSLKRKGHSYAYEATTSKAQKTEENSDLQFFRSILPDIDHFTKAEKRKFKMGVLKLIDDIENDRGDVHYKTTDKTY